MKTFNSLREWEAAVIAAGFEIELPTATHEGLHADDAYQPTMAYSTKEYVGERHDRDYVGIWNIEGPEGEAVGVLFDTPADYNEWQYEMDGEPVQYNREPHGEGALI